MKLPGTFVIYPYLPIVIGALFGAALGYLGACSSGACPLTSTWWRGALYGAFLGLLFTFSSPAPRSKNGPAQNSPSAQDQSAPHPR